METAQVEVDNQGPAFGVKMRTPVYLIGQGVSGDMGASEDQTGFGLSPGWSQSFYSLCIYGACSTCRDGKPWEARKSRTSALCRNSLYKKFARIRRHLSSPNVISLHFGVRDHKGSVRVTYANRDLGTWVAVLSDMPGVQSGADGAKNAFPSVRKTWVPIVFYKDGDGLEHNICRIRFPGVFVL